MMMLMMMMIVLNVLGFFGGCRRCLRYRMLSLFKKHIVPPWLRARLGSCDLVLSALGCPARQGLLVVKIGFVLHYPWKLLGPILTGAFCVEISHFGLFVLGSPAFKPLIVTLSEIFSSPMSLIILTLALLLFWLAILIPSLIGPWTVVFQ